MSAEGNWVLHYNWGNTGFFGQTPVTLKNDGTFTGPSTGAWRQQDGTILLSFDGGPAKYGGTVDAKVASGAMSTFAGNAGCWYMLKDGTTGATQQNDSSVLNAAGGAS